MVAGCFCVIPNFRVFDDVRCSVIGKGKKIKVMWFESCPEYGMQLGAGNLT
jgi:hypothetical protein